MDAMMEEMKQMSQLSDEDRRLLAEMAPALTQHAPAIVEAFYAHLETFAHLKTILYAQPGRIEKLKNHLRAWLVSLAEGVYADTYYERRYRIGKRHVEVGLEPRYVIGAMAFCRSIAAERIIAAEYAAAPDRDARARALNRVMDIDLNIMLQSYDDHRIAQFLDVTGFSRELFDTLMSSMT